MDGGSFLIDVLWRPTTETVSGTVEKAYTYYLNGN